jgi:peptidoglycan/xylan/chitin deacetylase (PgdA/CDA1 family)
MDNIRKRSFSPAEKAGVAALLSAALLFWFGPFPAAIPLVLFLLLCAGAPFVPGCGFYLPVISRGQPRGNMVSLTFDDGPSPSSTPMLLDLLDRYQLPATFFVVGKRAAKYPGLIARIVAEGHTIGNHSWNHDYFLMLRRQETILEDIHHTQEVIGKTGIQPLVFRPPVGITGPRLGKVLAREGLITVTYSRRALDRGNRHIHNLAGKILKNLRPGDIIMLHDLPAYRKIQSDEWHNELDRLFYSLATNYHTVPLARLIERPVNRTVTVN